MGKPKQLYSDEEPSLRSAKMVRFLNGNELKSVQTTTHAHTVERFIRTFKDTLHRRLDASNEDRTKWVTHTNKIILKHIIQPNIALLRPSRMKLVRKKATFALTGIFKMQPKIIENTLI